MYITHHSSTSQTQMGLRSIKDAISNQISFWLWNRKLSKQYNDIMKHKKNQPYSDA